MPFYLTPCGFQPPGLIQLINTVDNDRIALPRLRVGEASRAGSSINPAGPLKPAIEFKAYPELNLVH